ncbi:MAG: hypothetical protein A3F24_00485 [Candidatus Colwellbacteria bacterium RIFCSPHIGHO2_12_FULL_44_17]|uniref:DUF2007 domain-containing protein n=1 Tax=Candidatus Colwellbacteria bacterium RIFCSPHIGHO2_12_FULL_44_17 TaxID=1797689 RepID=A0A1G1Z2L6_9BACT|nr:MAG: hypothetical protein A3F24_00485 [Candidatus Colwellbacteria bacterium RIFCSPHIGHO2_12_FULL_44_17]
MSENNKDLVFLKNFATYNEAELEQDLLEKYCIKSVIQKGDIASIVDFVGHIGEANLLVTQKDYQKAKEILEIK